MDFMRSMNMDEVTEEGIHIQRLGTNRRLLAVEIKIIINRLEVYVFVIKLFTLFT